MTYTTHTISSPFHNNKKKKKKQLLLVTLSLLCQFALIHEQLPSLHLNLWFLLMISYTTL